MDDLRYAVGGSPIDHSLSPLLFNLVLSHLQVNDVLSTRMHQSVAIIETKQIDELLGWAYIEHDLHQPIWQPAKQRLKTFQSRLYAMASEIVHEESNPSLKPILESPRRTVKSSKLPTRSSDNEVWLNLTAPLKHQLQSMAFTQIDESLDLLSVNTLRYADQGWYCATTDGFGVVHVAHHFGIDVGNEAILGIHGGGGAARSIAYAWMKVGGRVASLGGKRQLPATLVNFKNQTGTEFDLLIDTEGTLDELPESKFILHPNYTSIDGTLEQRFDRLSLQNHQIDGRWMLAAQHLESWRCLWTPSLIEHLPSLEQLMTWMTIFEHQLAET